RASGGTAAALSANAYPGGGRQILDPGVPRSRRSSRSTVAGTAWRHSERRGPLMQVGMVGLGRMGGNMARRLMQGGHDCFVYDIDARAALELTQHGATPCASLPQPVASLAPP